VNIVTPSIYWEHVLISMHEPIQLSIVLFLIAGMSWLSNREMEGSLRRARVSEKALLEERDLLEIKVEERTSELKEAQKDKIAQLYRFAEFGKLSTGVFHDLMNSLNIVVNNVERIETTREHLPEVKDHMFKAVAASRRMGSYIQSVRKQIAAGDSQGLFSLQKEINDAVDIVSFKAREASVAITVEIADDIVLHGNALKFYQIILNLLMNAIEACEDNDHESNVTVTLAYGTTPTICELRIEDNGCGIDSETIAHVYTEFFTTKSHTKGTGFGLSQTKEIIEKEFNGTITITSTVHQGTLFTIILPITINDLHPADS
jgi:signal transduction histidine kinase